METIVTVDQYYNVISVEFIPKNEDRKKLTIVYEKEED